MGVLDNIRKSCKALLLTGLAALIMNSCDSNPKVGSCQYILDLSKTENMVPSKKTLPISDIKIKDYRSRRCLQSDYNKDGIYDRILSYERIIPDTNPDYHLPENLITYRHGIKKDSMVTLAEEKVIAAHDGRMFGETSLIREAWLNNRDYTDLCFVTKKEGICKNIKDPNYIPACCYELWLLENNGDGTFEPLRKIFDFGEVDGYLFDYTINHGGNKNLVYLLDERGEFQPSRYSFDSAKVDGHLYVNEITPDGNPTLVFLIQTLLDEKETNYHAERKVAGYNHDYDFLLMVADYLGNNTFGTPTGIILPFKPEGFSYRYRMDTLNGTGYFELAYLMNLHQDRVQGGKYDRIVPDDFALMVARRKPDGTFEEAKIDTIYPHDPNYYQYTPNYLNYNVDGVPRE